MSNRLKLGFRLIVGLVVVTSAFVVWFTRDPTTELVDASGKELTAGGAPDGADGALDASPFDDVRVLIERKEFADAKHELLRLIEESDRDGEACILLCDVSRELKEVEAAVDYGLKAVELLPDSAEAHFSNAKAIAMQIVSNMQGIAGIFGTMKGMTLFKEEIDRVIELDPEDTEARTMSVYYYLSPVPIGNIDRAIEIAGEIEDRDPVSGKQLLAVCYHRKKETERAIRICQQGLEQYPEEYRFHVTLADIYAKEKRFGDADAEFEAARHGEKGDVYYRALYGQALMRIKNEFEPGRAVELLDEFISAEPEGDKVQPVAYACWRRGNALEQVGRNDEARAAYEESLRREPELKQAKEALEALRE